MEESLNIRVMEIALKHPEGFRYSDIINNERLNLKSWEKGLLNRHFQDACERYSYKDNTKGETIFLFIEGNHSNYSSKENKYLLTLEAEFSFIDYKELKFARENAKQARNFSIVALIISSLALIASVIMPILVAKYMTQTIKIDESQIQQIK